MGVCRSQENTLRRAREQAKILYHLLPHHKSYTLIKQQNGEAILVNLEYSLQEYFI